MPPLRQPPPQPVPPAGSNAGAVAALAVAAPTAAFPASAAVGAGVTSGVLTVAAAQAVGKAVVAALTLAARKRSASAVDYVAQVARDRYPQVATKDFLGELAAREVEFERVFLEKMQARLDRDVPHALAIADPAERETALAAIVEREKRYSIARDQAMLERSMGALDAHLVKQLSPKGAYWKLSPHVMEHTLDCLAMGERFWPWSVLDEYHPPLHHGCPCYLLTLDEAVGMGLMRPDQVPDPGDAAALYRELMDEVDQLGESVSPEDIEAWVGWPGRLALVEAAVKHTGAMVALYPEADVARALAVKDGEPVGDIHLTLAFLGKAKDVADPERLAQVVAGWAASTAPLEGEVSGYGKFLAGPEPVVYASADVPGLPEARQRLVEALEGAGMGPSKEHGFTPHLTLCYDDRDVVVKPRALRFGSVALVLAGERQVFAFTGELSEARREPLRWARGLVKGGQFRPERGGSSRVAALRRALGDGPAPPVRRGERAQWRWVAGRYRRVPEAQRLELRRQGRTYVSPANSTNVYRDGKLVERGDPAERQMSPGTTVVAGGDVHDRVEALRHQRRADRIERARRALTWPGAEAPVKVGDGPEAVLALRDAGFRVEATAKGSAGVRTDYGLPHGGRLSVTTAKGVVTAVDWAPVTEADAQPAHESGGPARNWDAHVADLHAWVAEMAQRFGAQAFIRDVKADRDMSDHAGMHYFNGSIRLGKDSPVDIARAAKRRRAGEPLTDDEARGVWSTMWVSAHEGGHAVNAIDPMLWANDAHANLEEALNEEASHVLASERLQEQGQHDVLAWRARNPGAEAVRGGYLPHRHSLGELLNLAGVTEAMARRDTVMDLKFRLPPGARFDVLAGMIHAQHPERSREDWSRFVQAAMEVPGVSPDGGLWPGVRVGEYGGLKPSSYRRALPTQAFSPGREQVGQAGYGKWPGGVLSEGGNALTLPDGTVRRVERLPVMDGAEGLTDGTALTHYPPGQQVTDTLTYADGSPKNFRYLDNARRGRLILRAFTGKGSAGTVQGLAVRQLERDIAELEQELDSAEVWGDGDPAAIRDQLVAARGDLEVLSAKANSTIRRELIGQASKGTDPPKSMWDDFEGMGDDPPDPQDTPSLFAKASKWIMPWDKKDPQDVKKPWKPPPHTAYKPPKTYVPKVPPPPIPPKFIGGDGPEPDAGQVIPTYDHIALEAKPKPGPGAWDATDKAGNRFVVDTHQGDQDHVAAEVFAAALYRELGIDVPDVGTTGVKTPDFAAIPDKAIPGGDPPIDTQGRRASTGIIVLEGDKVWIYEPRNHYGGYEHTFPKGGVEAGLTQQQNAHKELWEETGLHATITGVVGDFKGDTSVSRYYVGVRTGGEPTIGAETQAVKLVTFDEAEKMLNKDRDKEILAALQELKPPHVPGKKKRAALAKIDDFPADTVERAVVKPAMKVGAIKGVSDAFAEGYAVDALLGNLGATTVSWDGDVPVRVSTGAVLGYRPDGYMRTFGPVPTDLWQMKGPKGKAFKHVALDDEQLADLAGDVADFLPDERIDALVGAAGFTPGRAAEVAAVLKARRDWMGAFAAGEVEIPGPMAGGEARGAWEDWQAKFKLLGPEKAALDRLIANPWGAVNGHLRSGAPKDAASDEVRADVKAIDGLFTAVPKSEEDAYVFSGLDMKAERAAQPDLGGLVGKTFKEKAFLPASFDMGAAGGYPAVLRILVPEGQRVASLGALGLEPAVNAEVLFPRSQEFRIVGRSEENGKVIVDAVALPVKPPQQTVGFSGGGKGYKPMSSYGKPPQQPKVKPPVVALTHPQEQIDLHLRHMKPGGVLQLGGGVTVERSKGGFVVREAGGAFKAFGEAKADRYDAVRLAEKLSQGQASPGTREVRAAVPGPPTFVTSNKAVQAENEKHAAALHALAVAGDVAGLKAYTAFSPKSGKLVKYKAALILALDPSAAAPQAKPASPKAAASAPSPKAVVDATERLGKIGVTTLPGPMNAADWATVVTRVADEAERLDKLWPGVMAGMKLVRALPGPGANGVYDLKAKTIKLRPKVGHSSMKNKFGKPWSVTETGGDSAFNGVLRHELGHHVDYNSPPPKKHRDALKATHFELDGKAVDTATWARANVSEYAKTNTSEALAEMFCMFTAPNYVAGTLPAEVEAIMKALAART